MQNIIRNTSILCAGLLLTACSTAMTESQCVKADWVALGERDAIKGKTMGKLDQRIDQCAEHDILADANAYQDGYEIGLTKFCTKQMAFDFGGRGKEYLGTCPADIEQDVFMPAYDDGLTYHKIKDYVNDATSELRSAESSIQRKQSRIRKLRDRLNNDADLSEEAKREIQQEIRRYRRDIRETRYLLDDLARDVYDAESEIQDFRAWARAQGYNL